MYYGQSKQLQTPHLLRYTCIVFSSLHQQKLLFHQSADVARPLTTGAKKRLVTTHDLLRQANSIHRPVASFLVVTVRATFGTLPR
jgi:hypothetical protein